jgi:hypothetical protein
VYKDGDVEDTVRVEVEVLDAIVPEHPLEEVASRQCRSTLHEPCEHPNLIWVLLYRVRIASGNCFLLAKETIVDQGEKILRLQLLAFFHLFVVLGQGEEGGGDDEWSASSASSRLIFFDTPVFVLFAGDAFILQIMVVFTRICSGAEGEGGLGKQANVDLIYFAVAAVAAAEQHGR